MTNFTYTLKTIISINKFATYRDSRYYCQSDNEIDRGRSLKFDCNLKFTIYPNKIHRG